MDVEIESLEIKAGVDNEKEQRKGLNQEYDEGHLERQIERCVERILRTMVRE